MPDKINFYLLILCAILSQRIIGTVGDEIEESSNFLLRQKRVVSHVPGEDTSQSVPYVVIIKQNMRIHCVGSILSRHVVITIPRCVQYEVGTKYQVFSGAIRPDRGISHNITDIKQRLDDHPGRPTSGTALLTVNPPFIFSQFVNYIPLHTGPLLQGTLGTVSGWGFNFRCPNRGTSIVRYLRSIQVPIIDHQDCVNRYQPRVQITDQDICTHHPLRYCGHTDGGAPLVVGNHLAGIHFLSDTPEDPQNDPRYPDVFVNLQHLAYAQWITTHLRDIELWFQVHRNY